MHDPNADPASPRRAHVRSAPVATMIGAEFAARVRGVPDADLVFPASNPRPIIWPRLSGPDYLAPIIWPRLSGIVSRAFRLARCLACGGCATRSTTGVRLPHD